MKKLLVHGVDGVPAQRAFRSIQQAIDDIQAQLDTLAGREVVATGGVTSVTGTGAATVAPTTGAVVVDVNLSGYSPTSHTHPESVPSLRSISTTAPLQGGGDLSANRTLYIDTFSDTVKGAVPAPNNGADANMFLTAAGTWADPSAVLDGLFGDGSDGAVTISSNTSLSRDMFYTNLTIDSGVTLNPEGYRIFVKGTLTLSGKIARNGNAGAVGAGGSGGAGGVQLGAGSVPGATAGGNGGAQGAGVGGTGGASTSCYASIAASAPAGVGGTCQGGKGGANHLGANAGTGPTNTVSPITDGNNLSNLLQSITGRRLTGVTFTGSSGGGGGAGSHFAGEGGGGGGGSGGGYIVVCAKAVAGSGTIEAVGGAGGARQTTGLVSGLYPAGGGAGGGGGTIILVMGPGSFPTCSVAGGVAGADNGYDGGPGRTEKYRIITSGGGGGGSALSDGDYGDITVSGTGSTMTIDAGAVTSTKIGTGAVGATQLATDAVTTIKIAASQVTTAKIADDNVTMAKIEDAAGARLVGALAAGNPSYLTGTQATTLLNLATTSVKGLAPVLPNDATKYLDGTGAYTVPAGSGGGGGSVFSGASVYNSGNQSHASGAQPAVTWDTELYDTDAYHSTTSNTSRFTIPATGKYTIRANIAWSANTNGFRNLVLYKNGTTSIADVTQNPTTGVVGIEIAVDHSFTAGDYVELLAYQTSGATLNITGQVYYNFTIARIGGASATSLNLTGCRAYKNGSTQNLSSATETAVTFDAEDYDTAAMHSTAANTSRITAAVAGYYRVTARTRFGSNGTGVRTLRIRKNATTDYAFARENAPSGTQPTWLETSETVYLAIGDYVEVIAYQDSGGVLIADTGLMSTSLSAVLVGT